MASKPQRKLLLVAIVVTLMTFSAYVSPAIPSTQALTSTIQDKGKIILSNVVGLNLANYDITVETSSVERSNSYLGIVPQENVMYKLTSNTSKLDALCTFVNGNLQIMQILDQQGVPMMAETATPSANAVKLAESFLDNYQDYTTNQLFGQLQSTLSSVIAGKNMTQTTGNTVLEITNVDNYTTFKWYYTSNDVIAPYSKVIALGFKDGFLTAFVDNWQLYNVGSTTVNISKEKAITIALDAAKVYASSMNLSAYGFVAANVNESNIRWASLIFDCSAGANNTRNQDMLTLYPVWSIGIALDKWYGQLYGIQVDIWADTGQVRAVQEAWSTLLSSQEVPTANMAIGTSINQTSNANSPNALFNKETLVTAGQAPNLMAIVTFLSISIGLTGSCLYLICKNKKSRQILTPHFKKGGLTLVVFILLVVVVSSFATVGATLQKGAGIVWGSESTGAYDPNFPPNYNTRKSLTEIGLQQTVANNITWNDLAYAGYDAYNHQGGGSVKSNVLYYLSDLHNTYDPIVVVDFDHGVGRDDYSLAPGEFHFMFEDEVGTWNNIQWNPENGIYDMDIYPRVNDGQVLLAFINTCLSANLTHNYQSWQGPGTYGARGMPYAWMHRIVGTNISADGYNFPDNGHQVYIGFRFGSASLSQTIPTGGGSQPQYYRWVQDFFYYATHYDMSVHDALDHASWFSFNTYFGSSPLHTGFNAEWWNMDNNTNYVDTMAVYGNANVHLLLRTLTVNAFDSNNNPISENVYIDGYLRGTTGNSFAVDSGSHTIQVGSSGNVFHCFDGYSDFSNPITVSVTQDTTITANYYANPPPQYTLSISTTDGGTTQSPYTPGNYQCTPGLVTITAAPYTNYVFLHWLLDGTQHTENPITVPMSSNHNLEAVFNPDPSYSYVSGITDYYGLVYYPENVIGWQNDGQFAQLMGMGPYHYYGWLSGSMNKQSTGHIYIYGAGNGPLYVYVSSDNYNWYLVSTPYVNSGSPYWIDCGTYASTFNYITLTAENPYGFYIIVVDSVQVQP